MRYGGELCCSMEWGSDSLCCALGSFSRRRWILALTTTKVGDSAGGGEVNHFGNSEGGWKERSGYFEDTRMRANREDF